MKPLTTNQLLKRTRIYIWIIIVGLFISGVTAFPIETRIGLLPQAHQRFPFGYAKLVKYYIHRH